MLRDQFAHAARAPSTLYRGCSVACVPVALQLFTAEVTARCWYFAGLFAYAINLELHDPRIALADAEPDCLPSTGGRAPVQWTEGTPTSGRPALAPRPPSACGRRRALGSPAPRCTGGARRPAASRPRRSPRPSPRGSVRGPRPTSRRRLSSNRSSSRSSRGRTCSRSRSRRRARSQCLLLRRKLSSSDTSSRSSNSSSSPRRGSRQGGRRRRVLHRRSRRHRCRSRLRRRRSLQRLSRRGRARGSSSCR